MIRTARRAILGAVAVATLTLASPAVSQTRSPTVDAPSAELEAVFTDANRALLCDTQRNLARPSAVLGEIAKNHDFNLFALPARSEILGRAIADNSEARAIAWIIASGHIPLERVADFGLTPDQHQMLTAIRYEFALYLRALRAAGPSANYRVEGPAFTDDATGDDALLAAFFSVQLGHGPAQVTMRCGAPPVGSNAIAGSTTTTGPAGVTSASSRPQIVAALRGRIDDLAVAPGSGAYANASNATVAYTDNEEKGDETVAIEATLGVGINLAPSSALFGFVQYTQNETETRATDDDDESKDVQALSAGLLLRRGMSLFSDSVFGTFGLTAYYTRDIENDADLLRGRLLFQDIVLNLRGIPTLCGRPQRLIGPLLYDCRLGAFLEGGHIIDAGRSIDLADNVDDEYLGAGFSARFALTLPQIRPLAPLSLSAEYRYMSILSGRLPDPDRWTLRAEYKITASNIAVGLSYEDGANTETFQAEELLKFTIGVRF